MKNLSLKLQEPVFLETETLLAQLKKTATPISMRLWRSTTVSKSGVCWPGNCAANLRWSLPIQWKFWPKWNYQMS
ncbi:MAG: hypothetical protein ACK4Q5_17125 [Saprospiraceae bacterium]